MRAPVLCVFCAPFFRFFLLLVDPPRQRESELGKTARQLNRGRHVPAVFPQSFPAEWFAPHPVNVLPQILIQIFAGSIKDKSGLPWGCIVQPFVSPEKVTVSATKVNAEKITRCSECFAYINAFAKFTRFGWVCPLCQTTNECTKR